MHLKLTLYGNSGLIFAIIGTAQDFRNRRDTINWFQDCLEQCRRICFTKWTTLWPCASVLWHFMLVKLSLTGIVVFELPHQLRYMVIVTLKVNTCSLPTQHTFPSLPGYSGDQLGPALHYALSGWVQQPALHHSCAIYSAGSNQDLQHYCHFQQQQISPLVFWTAPWKAMLPAAN